MKALFTLAAIVAAIAIVAQAASAAGPLHGSALITDTLGGNGHPNAVQTQGYRFITDTLGGNGHPKAGPAQGYRFITDTLGGNGHPRAVPAQGYRFITDTLGGNGQRKSVVTLSTSRGFSWVDTGIGASAVLGLVFATLGLRNIGRRRRTAAA